jgi:tRNA modification GTPase
MYDLNDTIVAVSSPSSGQRMLVRITGPDTISICEQIFAEDMRQQAHRNDTGAVNGPLSVNRGTTDERRRASLLSGSVTVDSELKVDAKLYLFFAPHSYTADDVAEIHIHTNPVVTEALMDSLLHRDLRMAGPGEFTARAYLNGKIDLTRAEAVNEVVVSSNKYQLAAAEKLLAGRLAETTAKVRASLMESLSLIEAGLDFSGEDIEFIARPEAVERLVEIKDQLEQLLSGSIRYESVVDLPSVGIAGVPNAGKSSLLNTLLGKERSIVSEVHKTTRDVLTGVLTLAHCKCVLFDCAGLISETNNILDKLAQQAAIEALRNSSLVVFCVDIAKAGWYEDTSIRKHIESQILIPVATKSDLLSEGELAKNSTEFLPISVETGAGVESLRETIDGKIVELAVGKGSSAQVPEQVSGIALTTRHKQGVTEAIGNVIEAANELKGGNDEVASMMLRAAYQVLSDIESAIGQAGRADEQILERIFSRFCIGK